jgi:hypothetical protein
MVDVDPLKIGDKLATAAQAERHAEKAALRDLASSSPELQVAAKAHAKRLAVKEQVLLNLWRPLAKWAGVSREYFATDFPRELAAKLEDVSDEDLQTPKVAIVAPAMEALGYSLDEPGLKEMYLNLLAGAATKSTAAEVHPSFVDVIRQLSSEEAEVLDAVLRTRYWALARIVLRQASTKQTVNPCVLDVVDQESRLPKVFPKLASWVNNWERLGLVERSFLVNAATFDGSDAYLFVKTRPEWVKASAEPWLVPSGSAGAWTLDFDPGSAVGGQTGSRNSRVD